MSLGVNKVNFTGSAQCSGTAKAKAVENTNLLKQNAPADSVNFKGSDIAEEDQKEIIRSARTKAAGWAIFGGIFSTLYYGLRSNKTVAEKYNLDEKKDKSLIKEIKNQQMLWTLPSMVPAVGLVTGLAAWLYNKNLDPEKIDL